MSESQTSYTSFANNKTKNLLTFIGSLINSLLIGNSLTWLYFFKYLIVVKDKNKTLSISIIYILYGLIITLSNISNLIINFFIFNFNIRTILCISYFFILISYALIYSIMKYIPLLYSLILSSILYSIGISIPFYSNLKNIWAINNDTKNIYSFLNIISMNFSSIIFTIICRYFIIKYNNNLIKGVNSYIWFNICVYYIIGLISIGLTHDFKGYYLNNENNINLRKKLFYKNNKIKESENILSKFSPNDNSVNFKEINLKKLTENEKLTSISELNSVNTILSTGSQNTVNNPDFKNNLITKLKEGRFILILIDNFLIMFFNFIMMYNFLKYHNNIENNNYLIYYIISISITKIFFPFIFELLGIKFILIFINIIEGIFIFFYIKFFYYFNEFIEIYIIAGILYGINSILFSTIINKIYGTEISFYLSSIINIFGCLNIFLVYLLNFYNINEIIIRNLSIIFNLNAIILSFFINEEDNNENKTILEENEELEEFEIQANLDEFSMN